MQWLYGCVIGSILALVGLLSSYWFDTSTGATIVCVYGFGLALFICSYSLKEYHAFRKSITYFSVIAVLLTLFTSAAWFAFKPKADQPLVDIVENYLPEFKFLYFSSTQKSIYLDAEKYVQRYKNELNRLSELEAKNRWMENQTDDFLVQKISSFQQSYNEMIKGETFVMREMRSRAREAIRWYAATLAIFLFALIGFVIRNRNREVGNKIAKF
jgi:zinc/manganese transport system permease protein